MLPPGRGWQDFWPRRGHHGPHLLLAASLGEGARRGAPRGPVRRAHSLLSLPSQLHRFVSVSKLKYFFAVDTAYVAKKLGLLVFPYTHQVSWQAPPPSSCPGLGPHSSTPRFPLLSFPLGCRCHCQNWEVQYSRDVPLPPRQDLNAPDLYIPSESLTWAGGGEGTWVWRHQRGEGRALVQHLLSALWCVVFTQYQVDSGETRKELPGYADLRVRPLTPSCLLPRTVRLPSLELGFRPHPGSFALL